MINIFVKGSVFHLPVIKTFDTILFLGICIYNDIMYGALKTMGVIS